MASPDQFSLRRRGQFVVGLQLLAGLLMAQQVGGKAARDGLFLLQFGPAALPAMVAGAAGFSVALSILSGRVLTRFSPGTVLPWALGVSGFLQLLEWYLLGPAPRLAPVLIYLHMAGLGAVLLSAFWSLLSEEFDPREAKQRFGQIAAGGTIGGLAGGLAAERIVAWFGEPSLMAVLAMLHVAGGILLGSLGRKGTAAETSSQASTKAPVAAFDRSSLLTTLATLVLLSSVGAALLDYSLKVYATEAIGRGRGLVRFFALFYTGVALLSFLLQSVLAKPLLQRLGLGKTSMTLPATLLAGAFCTLAAPGIVVAAAARAAESAVRGSLFRAGYETCFTAVPAAERRRAKTFIDVGFDRGGEAFGAAIVFVCINLDADDSLVWVLGVAAQIGLTALVVCGSLDQVYLKALARNLVGRAVQLTPDSDMDLTTRSLVLRTGVFQPAAGSTSSTAADPPVASLDPAMRCLAELRSTDLRRVQEALATCDIANPLIATQVCQLLGHDGVAPLANAALHLAAGRHVGLLADLMSNPDLELSMRRRIPRIIGSVHSQRATDALLAGLQDVRFEVRLQCARALLKSMAKAPEVTLPKERIMAAVDSELEKGRLLWESHQAIQEDPGSFEHEFLDEVLADKAHRSLEYVFILLSLFYERAPLMAAFRSLHVIDTHLRGTALEYLEGVLPARTRDLLWKVIDERPSASDRRSAQELMNDLLNSSETVVMRLRQRGPG